MGGNVYCLHHNGYSAFGVDFAGKTIEKINKYFPELKIRKGDVRNLEFENNFFDGYWSLGVIEHFYHGYLDILKEMKRVIKSGGYVFVTFPYISPLRRFKAKLGSYKKFKNNKHDLKKFYQFAFDRTKIKDDFEKYGFMLKYFEPFDGIKGFKDEVLISKPILQKLYDYRGKSALVYKVKSLLNSFLVKFSSHMILMVFQKRTESKRA